MGVLCFPRINAESNHKPKTKSQTTTQTTNPQDKSKRIPGKVLQANSRIFLGFGLVPLGYDPMTLTLPPCHMVVVGKHFTFLLVVV